MIVTFEEHTATLSSYEKMIILPAVIGILEKSEGRTLSSLQIIEYLRERNIKEIGRPTLRKIIHVIRACDMLPLLIATGKGYKISADEQEIKTYIQSLEERLERIATTKNAIKRQLKFIGKEQKTIWT